MLRYDVKNLSFKSGQYANVETLEQWGHATSWISVAFIEHADETAYVPLYTARKQRAELWQIHPFVHVKPFRHGDGMAVVPEYTPLRLHAGMASSYVSVGSDVQPVSITDLALYSTFSSEISKTFSFPSLGQTTSPIPIISTGVSDTDT